MKQKHKKNSSEIRDRFNKISGVKFNNPILCGLAVQRYMNTLPLHFVDNGGMHTIL